MLEYAGEAELLMNLFQYAVARAYVQITEGPESRPRLFDLLGREIQKYERMEKGQSKKALNQDTEGIRGTWPPASSGHSDYAGTGNSRKRTSNVSKAREKDMVRRALQADSHEEVERRDEEIRISRSEGRNERVRVELAERIAASRKSMGASG